MPSARLHGAVVVPVLALGGREPKNLVPFAGLVLVGVEWPVWMSFCALVLVGVVGELLEDLGA